MFACVKYIDKLVTESKRASPLRVKSNVYKLFIFQNMARRRSAIRVPATKQCANSTLKRKSSDISSEEEEDEEEQHNSGEINQSGTKKFGESLLDDDEDDDDSGDCGEPVDTVNFSGSTTAQSSSISSITYVASEKFKMSVIQKSNLLNWVDEVFSRHNKVLMLADLEENDQLHKKICQEVKISDNDWVKYRKEALSTVKTQITEKMSSHRKSVRSLYRGEIMSIFDESFILSYF